LQRYVAYPEAGWDLDIELVERPADLIPENDITEILLMVSSTGLVVCAAPDNGAPAGTARFEGPKPTPNSSTTSPAWPPRFYSLTTFP
jgi:hypothetical protein